MLIHTVYALQLAPDAASLHVTQATSHAHVVLLPSLVAYTVSSVFNPLHT